MAVLREVVEVATEDALCDARTGGGQIIQPSKEAVRQIDAILAQNAQILEMNARLLQYLSAPAVYLDPDRSARMTAVD